MYISDKKLFHILCQIFVLFIFVFFGLYLNLNVEETM